MREQWAEAFTATAKAWWTPERTLHVTSGKQLAILPGEAPVLLRAIGLLHRDASMPPTQVRKFRQINHMVLSLGSEWRDLRARFPTVNILDAGCGRSYLTTLLAWCFVHKFEHPIRVLGVDYSAALVEECRRRTELVQLEQVLRFKNAPIAGFDVAAAWRETFETKEAERIHAVVSLHACDTATDDAIALGMAQGAELIAVAPCCQSELNGRWSKLADAGVEGAFQPVWSSPHLRHLHASTTTDTFRMLLLRAAGYATSTLEFVASTHTPKNTLIRAIRRGDGDLKALDQYIALREATGGEGISLEAKLPEGLRRELEARG